MFVLRSTLACLGKQILFRPQIQVTTGSPSLAWLDGWTVDVPAQMEMSGLPKPCAAAGRPTSGTGPERSGEYGEGAGHGHGAAADRGHARRSGR